MSILLGCYCYLTDRSNKFENTIFTDPTQNPSFILISAIMSDVEFIKMT